VEVARHIVDLRPAAHLLLVGDGQARPAIEARVRSLRLINHVHFLGERDDVPRLLHAMNVFIFPSLYEGLPRALIEAQAAGLLCVASDRITREAAAGPDHVWFLPLENGAEGWAQTIAGIAHEPPSQARAAKAIGHFEAQGLSITANARELTELYERIAGIHRPTSH